MTGVRISDEEFETAFKEADSTGDDKLDFPEFVSMMSQRMRQTSSEEKLVAAFRTFDPENKGFIPTKDLSEALTTLGNPLTARELAELMTIAETVPGEVRYTAFINNLFMFRFLPLSLSHNCFSSPFFPLLSFSTGRSDRCLFFVLFSSKCEKEREKSSRKKTEARPKKQTNTIQSRPSKMREKGEQKRKKARDTFQRKETKTNERTFEKQNLTMFVVQVSLLAVSPGFCGSFVVVVVFDHTNELHLRRSESGDGKE